MSKAVQTFTRFWPALVVALVVLALGQRCQINDYDRELSSAQRAAAVANARTVERDRAVADADARAVADSLRADSLAAELAAVLERTPVVVTRWREVRDTASVEALRAWGDSVVAQLEEVEVRLARTIDAHAARVAGLRERVEARDSAIAARDGEIDALRTYARELETRLEGGDPIWPTVVLVGAGAAGGGALEGVQGALVGAGVGLGVDVVMRGVKSLARSIR